MSQVDDMAVTVEISLSENIESGDDDVPDGIPDADTLRQWASAAYLNDTPAIASMIVTTADEIQQLNRQYRQKDAPTNVLSFPMQTPAEIDVPLLGDIALCASVIRQESLQQNKPEVAHWAHMVVHAMLHLQGYDHIEASDADVMEALEIKILDQLGYANPYTETV